MRHRDNLITFEDVEVRGSVDIERNDVLEALYCNMSTSDILEELLRHDALDFDELVPIVLNNRCVTEFLDICLTDRTDVTLDQLATYVIAKLQLRGI